MLRKSAMLAFATRNRALATPRGHLALAPVRPPELGEMPLSDAEVWHGIQHGLIAVATLGGRA
jgi:hypothetical protein